MEVSVTSSFQMKAQHVHSTNHERLVSGMFKTNCKERCSTHGGLGRGGAVVVKCWCCGGGGGVWERGVSWCAVPCRAVPCRAVPCRAVPCRAVPCRAEQSREEKRREEKRREEQGRAGQGRAQAQRIRYDRAKADMKTNARKKRPYTSVKVMVYVFAMARGYFDNGCPVAWRSKCRQSMTSRRMR